MGLNNFEEKVLPSDNVQHLNKLAEVLAFANETTQRDLLGYPEVRAQIVNPSDLLKVLAVITRNQEAQEILQKDERLAGFFEEVRLSVAAVCFAAQQKMMRENCPEPVLEQ